MSICERIEEIEQNLPPDLPWKKIAIGAAAIAAVAVLLYATKGRRK